ncbi:MAG: hypothetical protein AB1500_00955 [Bacillota bacterium]
MQNRLQKADFIALVCSDNEEVRKRFQNRFSAEINAFVEAIFAAYEAFERAIDKPINNERIAYVAAFLFNALDNLVVSTNLLLAGHLIVSGHLTRQFGESVAMALLLSNDNLNFFSEFKRLGPKYPVHKSLNYVSRNLRQLGLDRGAWAKFMEINQAYDTSSHASAFSLCKILHFDSGGVSIGGDYDSSKELGYEKELKRRISAARSLQNVIEAIHK